MEKGSQKSVRFRDIWSCTATISGDLTKDVYSYAFARGRAVQRIYNFIGNYGFSVRPSSNQLYGNRISFHSKINESDSNNITIIFKSAKKKYKSITTDKTLLKHPAIKEILFLHARERANHLRGNRYKKSVGVGSQDFRQQTADISETNTGEYFPDVCFNRTGLINPSNQYIIRIHSIVLIDASYLNEDEENEFPWRYLLCTNGVHSTCNGNMSAPIGGYWMQQIGHIDTGKFIRHRIYGDFYTTTLEKVMYVNGEYASFKARCNQHIQVQDDWEMIDVCGFNDCLDELIDRHNENIEQASESASLADLSTAALNDLSVVNIAYDV
eukprot:215760_1